MGFACQIDGWFFKKKRYVCTSGYTGACVCVRALVLVCANVCTSVCEHEGVWVCIGGVCTGAHKRGIHLCMQVCAYACVHVSVCVECQAVREQEFGANKGFVLSHQ